MSYFPLDRELLTSSIWSDASPAALKVWFFRVFRKICG